MKTTNWIVLDPSNFEWVSIFLADKGNKTTVQSSEDTILYSRFVLVKYYSFRKSSTCSCAMLILSIFRTVNLRCLYWQVKLTSISRWYFSVK